MKNLKTHKEISDIIMSIRMIATLLLCIIVVDIVFDAARVLTDDGLSVFNILTIITATAHVFGPVLLALIVIIAVAVLAQHLIYGMSWSIINANHFPTQFCFIESDPMPEAEAYNLSILNGCQVYVRFNYAEILEARGYMNKHGATHYEFTKSVPLPDGISHMQPAISKRHLNLILKTMGVDNIVSLHYHYRYRSNRQQPKSSDLAIINFSTGEIIYQKKNNIP